MMLPEIVPASMARAYALMNEGHFVVGVLYDEEAPGVDVVWSGATVENATEEQEACFNHPDQTVRAAFTLASLVACQRKAIDVDCP